MHFTFKPSSFPAASDNCNNVWTCCSSGGIDPLNTIEMPQSTPTPISQSFLRPPLGDSMAVGSPMFPRLDQIACHIFFPLSTSALMAGCGEEARERNMLFKHSKAHTWIAPRAEVEGGWGEGIFAGGNDSDVGSIKASSGCIKFGRKFVVRLPLPLRMEESFGVMSMSRSSSSSISSSSGPSSAPSSDSISISGSGRVAQTLVKISRPSWIVRNFVSKRSSSNSSGDLWSSLGVF